MCDTTVIAPSGTGPVDSGLPLQPLGASVPQEVQAPCEVGVFWMILREWSRPPAMETCWSVHNVLLAALKIFWWLLPDGVWAEIQTVPAPGHWKADVLLKWCISSVLSGTHLSFLQAQRPCIQPVQTLCSLVFQTNVLFSQIMLLEVLHFQVLYSISVLKLFRVLDFYECLNLQVEQLISNRNIARFTLENDVITVSNQLRIMVCLLIQSI